MSKAQSLEPRRRPESGAARKTVDRILASTATLLDDIGFDAISTNLIAEHATVNVASLYKYFPNKYAVLVALADEMRDLQLRLLSERLQPESDWRDALTGILDAYVELFVFRPGFAELAAVMSTSASLREVDQQSLAAEASVIAQSMVAFGLQGTRADREAIARVMLEAARGVLPLVRRAGPAGRRRLRRELHRMLEAYLASYLEV